LPDRQKIETGFRPEKENIMSTDVLRALVEQPLGKSLVGHASSIEKGVPVYDCAGLAQHLKPGDKRDALRAELTSVLLHGSGVFVLKHAYADTSIIDEVSAVFLRIIADEKEAGGGADHFAAKGANDRIWNSLEKLCRADPALFARYHANGWIDLAAEAWLGPAYQVTAQVNLVHPGGAAQEAHCDYHLGFMTQEQVAQYPPHVHALSAQLTLQGAIAHCDMPVESGTTKLLPGSQNWPENYLRYRDDDVRAIFDQHHIQLPLEKGDLLFFSPGMLHAAGENKTGHIERMANLLQISSAFGIPLESVNRTAMSKLVYPALSRAGLSEDERNWAIAACGEGYPFPTNLDTDPPVGGLAPPSQQDLMRRGLEEGWTAEEFSKRLDERNAKRWSG